MVAETGACFLYGFLAIDAALRAKQAKVVKTYPKILNLTSICYVPVVGLPRKVNY
jgi:hypothetical protein